MFPSQIFNLNGHQNQRIIESEKIVEFILCSSLIFSQQFENRAGFFYEAYDSNILRFNPKNLFSFAKKMIFLFEISALRPVFIFLFIFFFLNCKIEQENSQTRRKNSSIQSSNEFILGSLISLQALLFFSLMKDF